MAHYERPRRSSPPSTQHHNSSPDTSLSISDRSLRSIHSAPSLTSSATLSNPSLNLNLNVHLVPLPNSHLRIHSGSGDSIQYSGDGGHVEDSKPEYIEDSEADDTVRVLPPSISITPSQERPQPDRTDSEQTVAASPSRNGSPDPQTQRISVHSDAYTEDDTVTEESASGVTDELRRTLFYRPSTDPIIVAQSQSHLEPEPDIELNAMLSTGATSSTNLFSSTPDANFLSPASDTNPLPTNPEVTPPTRPPRPPSLNLSDADEPKPKPKSVDLVRPGAGHSRMGSLGALFGKGNRSSFGGARSSFGGGRPSLGGNHSHSGSVGTVQGGVLPLSIKGKSPEPFPADGERVVEVHQVGTEGVGLTRARTISEGSVAEMDRSVWEDDTEELRTAWGMVRKWLGDENKASTPASNSLPSKKQKPAQHARKSLSLASTIGAFRTPPTSPSLRDSTPLAFHDRSGPALRESSVLGLHESSVIGSTSTVGNNDWANASTSRASFQTANASFQTQTEAPSTSFQTANASTSGSRLSVQSQTASFHSMGGSTSRPSVQSLSGPSFQSLSASQPSFHSLGDSQPSFHGLGASRRSFQSRRLGPRASVGSSLSSLAEPPESPTMIAGRLRSATVSSHPDLEATVVVERGEVAETGTDRGLTETGRPRSELLVVPRPESKPLFAEPEPQKRVPEEPESPTITRPIPLPSPPSSPSPNSRGPTTTARSLHNPTYPSLHKRLGSLVQHSAPRPSPLRSPASPVRSQAPASPLWSQPSSSSPRWNQAGPSSPLWSQQSSSPRWSPLYPPSPSALGMSMNMDASYKSDVRPISGVTESSYYGRGSGAGTAGRPESGATWAGSQRELLAPPQVKTVRIIDSPDRGRRIQDSEGLPSPPPSASRVSSIFRVSPVIGMRQGPRVRRRRHSIEYDAGLSPGKWFALGFVLGPWCWLIGGWMLDGRNRVVGVVGDAEKGVRVEGEQWVQRCRVAAVVSGVAVLACLIAAIVYAVLGAR
ncbi:hypothetical protein FRC10_001362 [Ceratobasidium sp. 414]|nr:hypothetical protein FRC10_001362 [Ceratobasidium sp. 414]